MAKNIKNFSANKTAVAKSHKKITGPNIEKDYFSDEAEGLDILNEDAAEYRILNKAFSKTLLGDRASSGTILSGTQNKSSSQLTAFEKMDIVREGVSKKSLENLKEKAGLDYDNLAAALSVTRATLINKKGSDKFNISLSERIVSLADIYSYGYEVFEDVDLFNKWMFKPNRALGGKTPYHFIDNQFGREELRNIIGRIEYGVYS